MNYDLMTMHSGSPNRFVAYISMHESRASAKVGRQLGVAAMDLRAEIIQYRDRVSLLQKRARKANADETCSSGDKYVQFVYRPFVLRTWSKSYQLKTTCFTRLSATAPTSVLEFHDLVTEAGAMGATSQSVPDTIVNDCLETRKESGL